MINNLRRYGFALAVLVWLGISNDIRAQTKPAILYALPPDGQWVEYECKRIDSRRNERACVLRISSVGQKKINDAPHRWVEIKLTEGDKVRVCKFLVAEKAFDKEQTLDDHIPEAYQKDVQRIAKMSASEMRAFLGFGMTGDLKKDAGQESLKTQLGECRARRATAGEKKKERLLEYRCWLSEDAPFGWAKIEIHEKAGAAGFQMIFSAEAAKKGRDAKSEVDETKAGSK